MADTIRALCTELVNKLHDYATANPHHDTDDLVTRARAALSQPEPAGLSDEELLKALKLAINSFPPAHPDAEGMSGAQYEVTLELRKARAVEAATLARAQRQPVPPVPEGPTEQEWDALVESAWDKYRTVGYHGERFIYEGDFDTALGFVREELARWGNHPGSPDSSGNLKAGLTGSPADGEVVELAETLERISIEADAAQQFSDSETLARAADLLERLSPPQPVPVSERLPGPEDCDATGRCWWFVPASVLPNGICPYWCLAPAESPRSWFTHWLPAHALPLPVEVER